MGNLPIISVMRLVQAGRAASLAGVSAHQMREWCGRRGILEPDIPGEGAGNHALYSWKTILTIRIVSELRSRYRINLSAWPNVVRSLRDQLENRSYLRLRDCCVAIHDIEVAEILPTSMIRVAASVIFVPLNPHLDALAVPLKIEGSDHQLALFPAMRHS